MRHLILTRFSVKAAPDSPPPALEWLEDRLELLAAFCLPGIAGQTCMDFQWILFCDESTDRDVLKRLQDLVAIVPNADVVLTARQRSALPQILARAATSSVLLTTRLDSDDGLALGFIERTHEYIEAFEASGQEALLLNFQQGFKLTRDALYLTFNPHSAFMTLLERVHPGRSPRSVQTRNHGHLHLDYPQHQDASMIGWLQVIHGGNVSNRVLAPDVRVPREFLDVGFALHPEALEERTCVPAPRQGGAAFRQGLEDALVPQGVREPPPG